MSAALLVRVKLAVICRRAEQRATSRCVPYPLRNEHCFTTADSPCLLRATGTVEGTCFSSSRRSPFASHDTLDHRQRHLTFSILAALNLSIQFCQELLDHHARLLPLYITYSQISIRSLLSVVIANRLLLKTSGRTGVTRSRRLSLCHQITQLIAISSC